MITKADKGGAVVILKTSDYIKEAQDQLSEKSNYRILPNDPTIKNNELVNKVIERFKKEKTLSDKTAENLKIKNPRTPRLYLLPKIHKEGNPGRPVISSIDCHTSNISRFIDHHLQPLVKTIPSYVKDTNFFLNKINSLNRIPNGCILVLLALKSLYTNIPNAEGIASVKKAYEKYQDKTVETKVIITFLSLILTLNNFTFNSKNYLQTKGCAMGTICAPSYANLFMAEFESKYIFPLIANKSILYLRYIDDIFLIWSNPLNDLKIFLNDVNEIHPSIKFESSFSKSKIPFLDVLVYKDSFSKLQTTLYKKPTDSQCFLHSKSAHPKTLKDSIPYSQALRIKRICSTIQEFNKHSDNLLKRFVERGYKEFFIKEQIKRVEYLNRDSLLEEKTRNNEPNIYLSVTYSRALPNLKEVMLKHWHILKVNPMFEKIFEKPPLLSFRRNKNLKDLIGSNVIENGKIKKRVTPKIKGKCSPCFSSKKNLCCNQIKDTTTFQSNQTKKIFDIYHNVNCKSKHIIYLLECLQCKIQYVGKSETEFNLRINNHRKDVNNPCGIPASKHFSKPGHDFNHHAKFIIIEQLRNIDLSKEMITFRLKQRENFWIDKLQTFAPKGLNQEYNNC